MVAGLPNCAITRDMNMTENLTEHATPTESAPVPVVDPTPPTFSPRMEAFWQWATAILCVLSLVAALLVLSGRMSRAALPPDTIHLKADRFLLHKIASRPASGWSSVIVKLDVRLDARRQTELKALGADVYRHLPLIDCVAVRVPSRALSRLAALPFVSRVSTDTHVDKCDQFTVGSSGAAYAWQSPYNLSGNGITVAVVDSGVHQAQDLYTPGLLLGLLSSPRVIASVNFVSESGQNTTDDLCGHGTHVAGIIAGNGASSTGLTCFKTFYGIAPQVKIVNVRVLDALGASNVSTVISGIQWVVNNRTKYNIRVINLSLGHPVGESYTTDPLCQAVEQAWKAGIVVVCAAGNDGRLNTTQTSTADNEGWGTAYGSIQSPGNDPYVITVGATKSMDGVRADDRIATYSSRGPSRLDFVVKPDIVAPGNRVISVEAVNSNLANLYSATNQVPFSAYSYIPLPLNSLMYFRLSGTSMAAPVVSGAAALLLQKDPTLTPDTVKARLMISADKWGFPDGSTDACTFGAGYLNIPEALSCTATATAPATSPALYRDANGNVCVDLQTILWGTKVIWGTAGLTDLQTLYGNTILWGNTTLSNSTILWGNSVWTDLIIWGTSSAAVDLSSTAVHGE